MLGHRRKVVRTNNNSVRNDEESALGGGRQSRDPSPSHFGVLNLDNYQHNHHPYGLGNGSGLERLFLSMTHGPRRHRPFWTGLVPPVIGWRNKSSWWWIKLLLVGTVLNYGVFYIRYFTMSRPSWLYGSPIPYATVQACLGNSNDRTKSTGKSASSVPLQFLEATDANLYWEWHRFSTNSSPALGPDHTTRHRLLIAQYSGHGQYAQILDLVAPINAAYAQYWNCDFVLLQGTALTLATTPTTTVDSSGSSSKNDPLATCPSEPRSTFNKIAVLEMAYQQYRDRYDMVLLLDTDTMIVDFKVDITTLLPSSSSSSSSSSSPSPYLLAAHRVWRWDWRDTWDINAGITLWNIHHETFPKVLDQWKQQVLDHPFLVLERNDDQYFLQWVLLQQQQQQQGVGGARLWKGGGLVYSLTQEFNYYQGTVIQHFKRESSTTWSQSSLEHRLTRIQEAIRTMNCGGGTTTADTGAAVSTIPCPYPLSTKFVDRHANHVVGA